MFVLALRTSVRSGWPVVVVVVVVESGDDDEITLRIFTGVCLFGVVVGVSCCCDGLLPLTRIWYVGDSLDAVCLNRISFVFLLMIFMIQTFFENTIFAWFLYIYSILCML